MPLYVFKCEKTGKEFETFLSIAELKDKIPSPYGDGMARRVFTPFVIHEGLSRFEKEHAVGNVKQRKEKGEYMKDKRDKRKKEADPNSREAKSNELWLGNETNTSDVTDFAPEAGP